MKKEELVNDLTEVKKIFENLTISNSSGHEKLNKHINDVADFVAKILFIGEFSAGKSALINALLGGEELLIEDQSPQTAIATELVYSDDEYVERINDQGSSERTSLKDIDSLTPQGYRKYIYHVNRKKLKELAKVVLVDMPGFNSSEENHNKAISQYIGEAAAYVFVIDIEQGTITSNSEKFLIEACNYTDSIKFVLTKTDKVTIDTAQRIKDSISTELKSLMGKKPDLLLTSSRDSRCENDLTSLLSTFSCDELLIKKYGIEIISSLRQLIHCIRIEKAANHYDPQTINLTIHELEERKDMLSEAFKRNKDRLHKELQNNVVDKVLEDVKNALFNSVDSLANSCKLGNDFFQKAVDSIVRPIIISSSQTNVELCLGAFVSEIQNTISEEITVEKATEVVNLTKNGLDTAFKLAESGIESLAKYKTAYKILSTGLAVTTSFVAPVIELVIIFLPEIVGLINKYMSEQRDERLKDQIARNVIPNICLSLKPQLQKSMAEIEEQQLNKISSEFQSNLNDVIASMNKAMEEKEKGIKEIEKRELELDSAEIDINKVILKIDDSLKKMNV